MLNLAALEEALLPIKQVGYKELTFDIEGQSITLRPLLPLEEVEAQDYSNAIIEAARDAEGNVDNAQALNYFDAFRMEVLSHAVCQVNNLDLRDVEHVSTGQTTSGGQQVRVKRNVALRKIIKGWSRTLLSAAFAQYGELMARIEIGSENLVEYDPSDLDAEIKRTEERLDNLKAMREGRAKGDPNLMSDQVKRINEYADANARANQEAMRAAPPAPGVPPAGIVESEGYPPEEVGLGGEAYADEAEPGEEWADFDEVPSTAQLQPAPPPRAATPRQPVYPASSPPPTGNPAPPPPAPPPEPVQPSLPVSPISGPIDPNAMDSFGDVDDEATLLAEQQRILDARRRMAAERSASAPTALVRPPPHMRGRRESPGIDGGMRMASPEELVRMGIDPSATENAGAVARPAEELSRRGRGRAPTDLPLNQNTKATQSVNPNFKPTKK